MKTKKIGLVGIYFPGAYDALHENVPEGFELWTRSLRRLTAIWRTVNT